MIRLKGVQLFDGGLGVGLTSCITRYSREELQDILSKPETEEYKSVLKRIEDLFNEDTRKDNRIVIHEMSMEEEQSA